MTDHALPKKKRNLAENRLQKQIAEYLDTVLPPYSYRAHAVSNNPRSFIAGVMEKKRGMKKGFPDIIIIGPHGVCAFMEVKAGKGRLSPEQFEWGNWLVSNQAEYAVVRSVDDVRACLRAWNVPTKDSQ